MSLKFSVRSAVPEERPSMDQVLEALSALCKEKEERLQEYLEAPDLPSDVQERARNDSGKIAEILAMLRRIEVRIQNS